ASMPDAPDEIIRALREAGIASVVLTLGAQGSLVADEDGVHRVPAAHIDAVDTTGAGDAFIGALAMGLARGDALLAAARLASRVGAFAATGPGAQPSYPASATRFPSSTTLLDRPEQTTPRAPDAPAHRADPRS